MTKKGTSKVSATSKVRADVQAAPVKQQPVPVKHLRRDVVGCSACGKDHKGVLFHLRENWQRMDYPYEAKCPVSGKPVLLKLGKAG